MFCHIRFTFPLFAIYALLTHPFLLPPRTYPKHMPKKSPSVHSCYVLPWKKYHQSIFEHNNFAEYPLSLKSFAALSSCFWDRSTPHNSPAPFSALYFNECPLPQHISSIFFPATSLNKCKSSSVGNRTPYTGSAVVPNHKSAWSFQ